MIILLNLRLSAATRTFSVTIFNKSPLLRGNTAARDSLLFRCWYLRSNSYAGLIMRILFRDRHEILELLERLNEKELTGPEAILLRMCRV